MIASRRGFSLVEVLVAVAIVGVLLGLTLSATQRVRGAAAKTQCANRLRQIGLALHQYHGTAGALPPGVTVGDETTPYKYMNWHTRLLPYLEQDALWRHAVEAYRVRPNDYRVPPHPTGTIVPAFGCPADTFAQQTRTLGGTTFAFSSFLGVSGTRASRLDGVLYVDSKTRFADITDGTSNTVMAGERPTSGGGEFGWWYAANGQHDDGSADSVLSTGERPSSHYLIGCPTPPAEFGPGRHDDPCAVLHFWSAHPGGAHFLVADGAVRFVPYSAKAILPALATRAGGDPVEIP